VPSIDECQLGASLARNTSNAGLSPIRELCRSGSASDALSPECFGKHQARRIRFSSALHARAQLATRRSSTSAIPTIRKHQQRTSTTSLEPRSPPCGGFHISISSARERRASVNECGRACAAEIARVRGLVVATLSGPPQAPLDTMARGESFAPTRFGSDTSCRPSALRHDGSHRGERKLRANRASE